jgi:hypothetical protein
VGGICIVALTEISTIIAGDFADLRQFITRSTDGGKTFTINKRIALSQFNLDLKTARGDEVSVRTREERLSCNFAAGTCALVAEHWDFDTIIRRERPMRKEVATSSDSGATWTAFKELRVEPNQDLKWGDIQCFANICVTMYTMANAGEPAWAMSQDAGNTWENFSRVATSFSNNDQRVQALSCNKAFGCVGIYTGGDSLDLFATDVLELEFTEPENAPTEPSTEGADSGSLLIGAFGALGGILVASSVVLVRKVRKQRRESSRSNRSQGSDMPVVVKQQVDPYYGVVQPSGALAMSQIVRPADQGNQFYADSNDSMQNSRVAPKMDGGFIVVDDRKTFTSQ